MRHRRGVFLVLAVAVATAVFAWAARGPATRPSIAVRFEYDTNGSADDGRIADGIAIEIRAGGAVGRVGVPQESTIPEAQPSFYANVTIAGGPAPVRAYMHELMPDVLEGRIEPGRVFDRIIVIDDVPDGYRAMNEREAIKVMIAF